MTSGSFLQASRIVMGLRRLLLLVFLGVQGVALAQSGLSNAVLPQPEWVSASEIAPAEPMPGLADSGEALSGQVASDEAAPGLEALSELESIPEPEPLPGLEFEDPQVLRVEPVLQDGWLHIDADVHLPVSDDLRYFAERGVALYFTADLEIVRPRTWWFDSEVAKVQQTWRVVYNALTRQWRVGSGDLSLPEASLDDALSLVRNIRGWEVVPPDELEPGEQYVGRIRVRLDTSLLARPFRVDAFNSSAWSLSTPWKDFSFSISSDGRPQ